MVSVLNSRGLGVLADLHAQRACQPTNSPAVPETVLVQSLGITRWAVMLLGRLPGRGCICPFPVLGHLHLGFIRARAAERTRDVPLFLGRPHLARWAKPFAGW